MEVEAALQAQTPRVVAAGQRATPCDGGRGYNDKTLIHAVIPEGITEIGDYALFNCRNVISISLPSTVRKIGPNPFYGCTSLASIITPEGGTEIGSQAFAGCSSMRILQLPSTVREIGFNAFDGCSSLPAYTAALKAAKVEVAAHRARCSGCCSFQVVRSVLGLCRAPVCLAACNKQCGDCQWCCNSYD